jgi:hypothetical protein
MAVSLMSGGADWLSQEPKAMDETGERAEAVTDNGEQPAARAEPPLGYVALMGTEVRRVDREPLGRVAAAWPSYVFVEVSPGADGGYWVPPEAFTGTEGAALILSVTR